MEVGTGRVESPSEDGKRSIKSFVLRGSRLAPYQKEALGIYSKQYTIAFQDRPIDFSEVFGNSNPVILEIGFGMGHTTERIATQMPLSNFLAIEVFLNGFTKLLSAVGRQEISNLKLMRFDAVEVLKTMIPDGSISGFHIFFPDPWPKKRHRDRRLVRQEFLQTALYYLRPGGDFYFSTDFQDYAEDVAALLPEMTGYVNVLDQPLVTELPGYPLSKYMRRFLQQGQPIHFIHYRRDPHLPPEGVAPPTIDTGFRLHWRRVEHA